MPGRTVTPQLFALQKVEDPALIEAMPAIQRLAEWIDNEDDPPTDKEARETQHDIATRFNLRPTVTRKVLQGMLYERCATARINELATRDPYLRNLLKPGGRR